jgi:hypothetical protein
LVWAWEFPYRQAIAQRDPPGFDSRPEWFSDSGFTVQENEEEINTFVRVPGREKKTRKNDGKSGRQGVCG